MLICDRTCLWHGESTGLRGGGRSCRNRNKYPEQKLSPAPSSALSVMRKQEGGVVNAENEQKPVGPKWSCEERVEESQGRGKGPYLLSLQGG